jgi:TIGR03009 family protein
LEQPRFAISVVLMHRRPLCRTALLALAATILFVSSVGAQTKVPARTAQRAPIGADSQRPAAGGRAQNSAAQGQVEGPPAGQTPPKAGVKVLAPQPPFVLSESQQKLLDQVLIKWEQRSNKVTSFKCSFTRWDYDPAFGRPKDNLRSEGGGFIKYYAPDRGDYSVTELKEFDAAKADFVAKTDGLDHWVCDGKSIYEFVPDKKQLIVRKLPPDMQGKAIVDGPLPFVFGAKADQLKQRYWMRDITPKQFIGKEVWLEAVPKRQQDAANFQTATIILTDPDFVPFGLQILLPDGKNKSAYIFKDPKINDPLWLVKGDFLPPLTPPFWKKIVEADPSDSPPASTPTAGEHDQAKRPAPPTKRK